MPTYQYRCTECGHDLEAVQKFSDPALTECPSCHGQLRKVYNAVGVVFKGSGFYRTDSRKPEGSSSGSSNGSSNGSAKSEGSGSSNGSSEKSGGSDSSATSTPKADSAKAPAKAASGSSTGSSSSS